MTTLQNAVAVTDYDALLAELWNQPEDRVDFKEPFRLDQAPKKQVCGLVKDILGMSNRAGGGFIIIGKKDVTGEAINCDEDIVKSFDTTKVHDKVRFHGKPEPTFNIHSGTSPAGTTAIIIHVKEFPEVPVICSQTISFTEDKGPPILREGALYIRSKTGNARTCEVSSEQDMRDLIDRAVLKSGKKLTTAFEDLIGRYLHGGIVDPMEKKEAVRSWQKEQDLICKKLETLPTLSDPILQIIVHPGDYEKNLFDTKTLQSKLSRSASFHRGWSFPCPDFEITKEAYDFSEGLLIHASSKNFRDGELHSVFGLNTSGLMVYREEMSSAYDANRAGKPLLVLWVFLTIYRATGFLAGLFDFMPKTSQLKIQLLLSDTYQRLPCTHVYLPLDHPMAFFKATQISAPKISFEIEVTREEISVDPVEVTFKAARKIIEFTDAQISDQQLRAEIEKIADPA